MSELIQVWSWKAAPMGLRRHSTHGGDEDWVVLVPKEVYENQSHPFDNIVNGALDYMPGFGWGEYTELDNGDAVIIFAHS